MQKIQIEDLPQAVKDKTLTKQEAAKIVWAELYTHPKSFGLHFLSEDQKSDLLLSMHKTFEKFFDKFIPGTVSFRTFISACVINYRNNFLRLHAKHCAEKKCLHAYLTSKTEEDSRKYAVELENLDEKPDTGYGRIFSDITEHKMETQEQRSKRIAEITTLILLMKACMDIDDGTINSVCSFTGINKALVYKTIQELKESISRKSELQQEIVTRRNNAFFYHRKYMLEMMMPHTESKQIKLLKERYEKQTKRWKEENENLSVRSATPSNEEIAKALGIKPRTVSFYINHVKETKNREKIRQMLTLEEDRQKDKNHEEENTGEKN